MSVTENNAQVAYGFANGPDGSSHSFELLYGRAWGSGSEADTAIEVALGTDVETFDLGFSAELLLAFRDNGELAFGLGHDLTGQLDNIAASIGTSWNWSFWQDKLSLIPGFGLEASYASPEKSESNALETKYCPGTSSGPYSNSVDVGGCSNRILSPGYSSLVTPSGFGAALSVGLELESQLTKNTKLIAGYELAVSLTEGTPVEHSLGLAASYSF